MTHYIALPRTELLPDGVERLTGERDTYEVDTDRGMALAAIAMRDAEVDTAPVWSGDPDNGESVKTDRILFAADDYSIDAWDAAVARGTHDGATCADEYPDADITTDTAEVGRWWESSRSSSRGGDTAGELPDVSDLRDAYDAAFRASWWKTHRARVAA